MVKIIADTTSGIPVPEAKESGISYIPQIIIFGNKTYRDDNELDTNTFIQMLGDSPVLPKTAAPPPALYTPFYKEFSEQGHTIIVISPSKDVSGTFRSATVAAQDFPDADIRIIDTRLVAAGLATVVKKAQEMADNNAEADAIVVEIERLSALNHTYFMVDTLEFLHKGGRIGGAQALLGGILQIKPILSLVDGKVDAVESQRTHRKAVARLKELVTSKCKSGENINLSVMHGDAPDEAQALVEYFQAQLAMEYIPIYELPPAVLVHAGPGVLGVSYFTNK